MGRLNERIDQLLNELDTIARKANPKQYGLPFVKTRDREWLVEYQDMHEIVKKFMTDMGENIVRSQAVDEFVEYLKEYIDIGDGKMYVIVKQFKQEKGYE